LTRGDIDLNNVFELSVHSKDTISSGGLPQV